MQKNIKNTLLLCGVSSMLGLSTAVSADIKVYVKNCTGSSLKVISFNGKDAIRLTEYQSKTVKNGESVSLKCKGQGKGRCYVSNRDDEVCGNTGEQKVDKNKWIRYDSCDSYERNLTTEPSCN